MVHDATERFAWGEEVMKFRITEYSLQGARTSNQDRVAIVERNNALLMVLADGLGGHAGGHIASDIAAKWATQAFRMVKTPLITRPSTFLALTILQAHNNIIHYTKSRYPDMSPRTTLVMCLIQDGYAYWAHVGDSRLYHFRNDKLLTRTLDHSAVETMRQKGLIDEQEMVTHPHKGHVTRCLGSSQKPVITLGKETKLENGDKILLCSDGIWEALSNSELVDYLNNESLDIGVEEMLHMAEEKMQKACDNISAIAMVWEQKTTSRSPLQASGSDEVDQDKLWEQAKKMAVNKKPGAGKKKAMLTKTDPLADDLTDISDVNKEIESLETFLNRKNSK